MTVTRLIARPMLASMFVVGGANALKHAPALAAKAKPAVDRLRPTLEKSVPQLKVPEDTATLVKINGAAQILAGLALARGRAPRLSSSVLAASLLPTTVAGHQFWTETDPATKSQEQVQFFKNLSMLGGLLLAAVDTNAQPGVAWRTKRGVSTLGKEAKRMAREAKREAKLAAKSVG